MVKGPNELAACIQGEEKDGYVLDKIIWCGNLQVDAPAQILTNKGDPTKHGLIHLFLVTFQRIADMKAPLEVM